MSQPPLQWPPKMQKGCKALSSVKHGRGATPFVDTKRISSSYFQVILHSWKPIYECHIPFLQTKKLNNVQYSNWEWIYEVVFCTHGFCELISMMNRAVIWYGNFYSAFTISVKVSADHIFPSMCSSTWYFLTRLFKDSSKERDAFSNDRLPCSWQESNDQILPALCCFGRELIVLFQWKITCWGDNCSFWCCQFVKGCCEGTAVLVVKFQWDQY